MGPLYLFLLLSSWIRMIAGDKRIYEEGFGELASGDVLEFHGQVNDVADGSLKFNIELCATSDCKGTPVAILNIFDEQMISLFTRIDGKKIPGSPQQTIDAPIIKDKKFSIKITAGEEYGIQVNDGKPTMFAYNVSFTDLRYYVVTEIGDKSMILLDEWSEKELKNEAIASIQLGDKLGINGKVADDDFRFDISFCTDEECGEKVLNVNIDSNKTKGRSFKEDQWLNEQITPTKIVKGQEFKLIFSMENGIIRILDNTEPLHIFVVDFQPIKHLKMRCGFSVRTNACKTDIMDVKWTRANSVAVSPSVQPPVKPKIVNGTNVRNEMRSETSSTEPSAAQNSGNAKPCPVCDHTNATILWFFVGLFSSLVLCLGIGGPALRAYEKKKEKAKIAEWKRECDEELKEKEKKKNERRNRQLASDNLSQPPTPIVTNRPQSTPSDANRPILTASDIKVTPIVTNR